MTRQFHIHLLTLKGRSSTNLLQIFTIEWIGVVKICNKTYVLRILMQIISGYTAKSERQEKNKQNTPPPILTFVAMLPWCPTDLCTPGKDVISRGPMYRHHPMD